VRLGKFDPKLLNISSDAGIIFKENSNPINSIKAVNIAFKIKKEFIVDDMVF